jgi:putative transcriptional regulator
MQIHQSTVILSLIIILILPTFLSASSFPDPPNSAPVTGGFKVNTFSAFQDRAGFISDKELGKGRFLVAARRLKDPNFHKTVVLLIRYGADGASGVVINRPMNVKLSAVFPDLKELAQRKEILYYGGPVELNKILFLARSVKVPDESLRVFNDVYVSSSREELQRFLEKTNKDERFRIYAGYAGWAPKQLENECQRGDWHILKADAETLFDKKSSEIWQELIHRFSVNWVRIDTGNRSGFE